MRILHTSECSVVSVSQVVSCTTNWLLGAHSPVQCQLCLETEEKIKSSGLLYAVSCYIQSTSTTVLSTLQSVKRYSSVYKVFITNHQVWANESVQDFHNKDDLLRLTLFCICFFNVIVLKTTVTTRNLNCCVWFITADSDFQQTMQFNTIRTVGEETTRRIRLM